MCQVAAAQFGLLLQFSPSTQLSLCFMLYFWVHWKFSLAYLAYVRLILAHHRVTILLFQRYSHFLIRGVDLQRDYFGKNALIPVKDLTTVVPCQ